MLLKHIMHAGVVRAAQRAGRFMWLNSWECVALCATWDYEI
jgi:hypothetical protein